MLTDKEIQKIFEWTDKNKIKWNNENEIGVPKDKNTLLKLIYLE